MGDSKSDEIVETVVTKLLKVGENSRGKIDAKADGKLTEKEIEVVLETVRGILMNQPCALELDRTEEPNELVQPIAHPPGPFGARTPTAATKAAAARATATSDSNARAAKDTTGGLLDGLDHRSLLELAQRLLHAG